MLTTAIITRIFQCSLCIQIQTGINLKKINLYIYIYRGPIFRVSVIYRYFQRDIFQAVNRQPSLSDHQPAQKNLYRSTLEREVTASAWHTSTGNKLSSS